jgi:cytochrome c biogenesis protein CcmG/thiol:disulfide interchange protein DsbE
MSRLVLLIPLAVFAVIGLFFAAGLTRDPSRIPSMLIDRPLPEFSLPPIEGFETGLAASELVGEVAMINVFGSWCVSCLIEHPVLMELAEAKAVPIYGLNWKDKPGAGAAWLKRYGNPYRRIGDDPDGRVIIDLGVTGAPETFVIDKDGRVRYKYVGPITREVWKETLAPLVEELKKS